MYLIRSGQLTLRDFVDPVCDLWEPYGFVEAHGKQERLLLLLI